MGSLPNHNTKADLVDGLPIPDPCISFWQQTTRSYTYLTENAEAPVPPTSRYVIIGSGISGALTAFELTESGVPGKDMLILEAREAASGASSRNAGHVRPDAFRGFQVYEKVHGREQAQKIIANEREVFHKIDEFVKKHQVQCDFNPSTTLDVCMTQEFADFAAQGYEVYKSAGGDVSHIKVYNGEEARAKTGIKSAIAAYEWPAGSSHPAKLAQWLLTESISRGVQLFTHCPATAVTNLHTSSSDEMRWEVSTPRGSVAASTIIHCTNAWVSTLIPELAPFVTPNRAQAHAIVPPLALSGSNMLSKTMSLRHTLKHFYSVAQRQPDGVIILGSSRFSPGLSQAAIDSRLVPDDRVYNEEVRQDAVKNFEACFPACSPEKLRHGEGLVHSWTGIIGMTTDSVPFVGQVDGLPGQWVCAGFNGHGMARIFTSAPGLVKLVRGGTWANTGLPECFEITKQRLQHLSKGTTVSVF